MSRIGDKPIVIPEGVTITINGQEVTVKGPKGELNQVINDHVAVEQVDNELVFKNKDNQKFTIAIQGTMRSLVANMVEGVTTGFKKQLELIGVGYRAQMQGNKLVLSVGLSHPVEFEQPEGVTITAPTNTQLVIEGANKEAVGALAANIRAVRPPEPYNGKGIKYHDEQIIRKEGKTG